MFAKRIVLRTSLNSEACMKLIQQCMPPTEVFSSRKVIDGIYDYELKPRRSSYIHFTGYIAGRINAQGDGDSEITAETELSVTHFLFLVVGFASAMSLALFARIDPVKAAAFVIATGLSILFDLWPWVVNPDHGLKWLKRAFSS